MSEPSLTAGRVLVVAESPFEAPFIVERLAAQGATACHVTTVAAARTALYDQAYETVLIDGAFDATATAKLASEARARGAKKILVLLSPFERRVCEISERPGFDGWLVKPVRHASLCRQMSVDHSARTVAAPKQAANRSLAVLLAEDNPINALLALRHLERIGAHVVHAPDGLTALALAETALEDGRPYDAMIVDIRMPGLDGISLARRVRLAETAHGVRPSHIVALSADLAEADSRSARIAGIDECLGKPVSYARLEEALSPGRLAYA